MWPRLRSFATMIFRRSRWERDLRDEFDFHLQERADAFEREGLARGEAISRARIEFRRMETAKEECREARGARWVDETSRNLTWALRSVRQHPGFSSVAVISLALGISANLAVFGVLHRLLLTTLPVRDPGSLYQIGIVSSGQTRYTHSYGRFQFIADNFDIFTPLFGWGGFNRIVSVDGARLNKYVVAVTGNFFDTLGVTPFLGRLFDAHDDQQKTGDLVVIGHQLWRSAYSEDPAIVGRKIEVAGQVYSIAGVTPPTFVGFEPGVPVDVYLNRYGWERLQPNAFTAPGLQWFHTVGRLKPGVSPAAAQTMLRERWPAVDDAIRLRFKRNSHDILIMQPGGNGYSSARLEFSLPLIVLMGLVGAVLLIACANVATLLFVRGADRVREMSIRLALGASRPQLIRQWLTECMLLAVAAGIAGSAAARWITDGLLLFVSEGDRDWLRFDTNMATVLVTFGLTLAAGLACGLLPAFKVTATAPDAALRAHGSTAARRGGIAQLVLAAQLAASLVLIVGGTMFARTLWNLNNVDPGFDRRSVVYAEPDFGRSAIARAEQGATMESIVERLRRSPLIEAASMGDAPMVWADGGWAFVYDVPGYTLSPGEDNTVWGNFAQTGYFATLGMRLVAGREFTEQDRPRNNNEFSKVIIINERMARHYFAGRDPIGQFIRIGISDGPAVEIVGVVSDVRSTTLREQRDESFRPVTIGNWSIVVARPRAGVSLDAVTALIQKTFAETAKEIVVKVAPLEAAVQKTMGRDRLVARLSVAFAALGIVLATIGLYAAIAHSVSSRTREIGIRIAIGADSRDVMWMVLKHGVGVIALGVVIGLPVAVLGSRLIRSLLYEVSPTDPVALAASSALLALTGLTAGLWPARRAAKLDPSQTLRFE
jgi:predicted permease